MLWNQFLTLATILMGTSFNCIKNAGGILDISTRVESASSNSEKCLMEMMTKRFKRNTTVTMFLSNNVGYSQLEVNLIKNIFNSSNCSVVLYTQMTHPRMTPLGARRNFLIMLSDQSLKLTLNILHSFYIWDSKAVFLVVVGNIKNQTQIIVENSKDRSFNNFTQRVLVEHVPLNSGHEQIIEHYVSNPSRVYRPQKPYETLTRIVSCKVDGTYNVTKFKAQSIASVGDDLRVGVLHAPPFLFISEVNNKLFGSEASLINTIAEKLNMSISYRYYSNIDSMGDLYVSNENSIYGSGMINDLLVNKIDVAVGNMVLSERVHKSLAVSTPYTVDQLIWIIPTPRVIFKLPFFPFIYSLETTLFLLSMYWIFPYLAFMATNHFHRSSNDECSRYQTFRGTCITFFAMSTGSTVDITPKTIRMRVFLFIWLFYTYHLNMYFSSTLIWFFAGEQHCPSFNNFDELDHSGMELGIDKRTLNYFKDQYAMGQKLSNAERAVSKKLVFCNSTSACLTRVARYGNFSMTLSYNYFTYAKHMYRDEKGKSLLKPLPQPMVSVPIGIVSKKGFIWQRKLNIIILRINEAGLYNYWKKSLISNNRHIFSTENNELGIESHHTLTFYDLKMVFIGGLLELFVCCLVFIGELIVDELRRRIKSKKCNLSNDDALFDYVN